MCYGNVIDVQLGMCYGKHNSWHDVDHGDMNLIKVFFLQNLTCPWTISAT